MSTSNDSKQRVASGREDLVWMVAFVFAFFMSASPSRQALIDAMATDVTAAAPAREAPPPEVQIFVAADGAVRWGSVDGPSLSADQLAERLRRHEATTVVIHPSPETPYAVTGPLLRAVAQAGHSPSLN